jgi:hypothetical protein
MAYTLGGLAKLLGLDMWMAERAFRDHMLPEPDLASGRWSARLVRDLVPKAKTIREWAGSTPDVGAWRASDFLADKFGIPVTAGGVEELAARGVIAVAGEYKGCTLYSGDDLTRLSDRQAVADAEARKDRNAADSARYMRIRPADFKLLAKCGFIKPARLIDGRWVRFPVYSCAALDAFMAGSGIDWAAVRATPRGKRTPVYVFCEPELIMLTLASL